MGQGFKQALLMRPPGTEPFGSDPGFTHEGQANTLFECDGDRLLICGVALKQDGAEFVLPSL